jgi:hypothetical protein
VNYTLQHQKLDAVRLVRKYMVGKYAYLHIIIISNTVYDTVSLQNLSHKVNQRHCLNESSGRHVCNRKCAVHLFV